MYALLLGVEDPAGTKTVRLPVVFVPMRLIMYFRIPRDEGGRKAGAMLSILPWTHHAFIEVLLHERTSMSNTNTDDSVLDFCRYLDMNAVPLANG